jgi:hypothetical protein
MKQQNRIALPKRNRLLNDNASFCVLMQVKLATSLSLPREVALGLDITITTMINEEL